MSEPKAWPSKSGFLRIQTHQTLLYEVHAHVVVCLSNTLNTLCFVQLVISQPKRGLVKNVFCFVNSKVFKSF